jgi:hypothetical protein
VRILQAYYVIRDAEKLVQIGMDRRARDTILAVEEDGHNRPRRKIHSPGWEYIFLSCRIDELELGKIVIVLANLELNDLGLTTHGPKDDLVEKGYGTRHGSRSVRSKQHILECFVLVVLPGRVSCLSQGIVWNESE